MELAGSTRLLRALGDETRLRLLHLLGLEELSCSELMEVLNMGQSRVSTHLNLLKEAGLVVDRRAGRHSLYSLAQGAGAEWVQRAIDEARGAPEFEADAAGVVSLRARRQAASRSYFDRVAASFGEQILPGRTWEGLVRALLRLAPRARYVDIGVGDGLLTLMLAEVAESVTAVDISPEMLGQLRRRATAKGIDNLVTVEGELEELPLEDASFDVAVLSQALHHAAAPELALAEARRVLAPGGRLLVIDLLAHTEEWVRERHQHLHLGFSEAQLTGLCEGAGFRDVSVQRAARDPQPPHFMTLVATGVTAGNRTR
ncbi:MAG TPA: metalloregulator ArsR/SmtB family transcription factor [Planctomycetota bacterium]|nr:metalloregulator ArsR/SmtB family transcription factor [Planctomycetota bacterium]